MKRTKIINLVALISGLTLLFGLAACSSGTPDDGEPVQAGDETATSPVVVATVEDLSAEEIISRADEAFGAARSFRIKGDIEGDLYFGQTISGHASFEITWPDELVGEEILPDRERSVVEMTGALNVYEESIVFGDLAYVRCSPDGLWREHPDRESTNTLSGDTGLTIADLFLVSTIDEIGAVEVQTELHEGQSVYRLETTQMDPEDWDGPVEIEVLISTSTFLPVLQQQTFLGSDGTSQITTSNFQALEGPIEIELPDESMLGEAINDPQFTCEPDLTFGSGEQTEPVQVTEEILASSVDGVLFDIKLSGSVVDSDSDRSFRDDVEILSPGSTEFQGHFPGPTGDLVIVSCLAPECQEGDGPVTFEVRYWTTDDGDVPEQSRQRTRQ